MKWEGQIEDISVFVMRKGNPVPLITVLIKMPVSESVMSLLHVYSFIVVIIVDY